MALVKYKKDGICTFIKKKPLNERCTNPVGKSELCKRKDMCPECAPQWCGAYRNKKRRTPEKNWKCHTPPIRDGNGRCRLHGGYSLVGAAKKDKTDLSHSQYAPSTLAAKMEESAHDPELVSLRSEIALTDARVKELLERITPEESAHHWKMAKKFMSKFRRSESLLAQAQTKADKSRYASQYREALKDLEDIIKTGEGDYRVWDDISRTLGEKRRLIESETKRTVMIGSMLSQKQALDMMNEIYKLIRDNVSDPRALSALSVGISNMIGNTNTTYGAKEMILEGEVVEEVIEVEI